MGADDDGKWRVDVERTAVVDVATINCPNTQQHVVAGKEIQPKRSSLIVHDTSAKQGEDDGGFINQQSPLLTSAAYMAATGAVEEYVNREKDSWPEYNLTRTSRGRVREDRCMDDTLLMTRCVCWCIREHASTYTHTSNHSDLRRRQLVSKRKKRAAHTRRNNIILTPSSDDGNNKLYSYKDRTQVQAHSDALTLLGPRPIIAGLSFGGR